MEYPSEQKTIHLHESFLSSTIPLAREVIMIVIILILIFFLLFFLLIGIGLARKRKPWPKSHPIYWSKLLLTVLALCFVFSMITQPKTVFDGAVSGLHAWWDIVFPSLLPFFIASELLLSFGIVRFMGVLLEPIMRPLFNVPGSGSFVLCIGFTSGYPIGSMVTARLRTQGLCTRIEAERLMSFTNNASPLFMLVAVSIGMFGQPTLGLLIVGAHYLSNLTLGILLRFYGRNDPEYIAPPENKQGILKRAFRELQLAWEQETRPLGNILGDVVKNAVTNLLQIGGFIILFAVLIKLLTTSGIIGLLAKLFGVVLLPLGFSPEILPALASGFFEMTIGSKLASEAATSLSQQVIAVSMILAWSGLSVHAQVASMISKTDIRILPFIITRIAHAALAAGYTWLLIPHINGFETTLALPTLAALQIIEKKSFLWASWEISLLLMGIIFFLLCFLVLIHRFMCKAEKI